MMMPLNALNHSPAPHAAPESPIIARPNTTFWEERAAIMEFDGWLPRRQAEREAYLLLARCGGLQE